MQTQCGTPPATGLPAHVRTIDPFVILDRMRAREALAAEIKRMVDLLDAIDGDPDLEPSLAGSPSGKHAFDAEGDDCDLEDGRDGEPSLGSFDRLVNQEHSWRRPCHYSFSPDLEADRADDEDGGDTELNGDETDWSDHSSGMDGGIGDGDGLLEQVGCCQLRLDARDTEGVRKAVGRLRCEIVSRGQAPAGNLRQVSP